MSIRDEIRAAIKDGQPFSAVGILTRVPSVEGGKTGEGREDEEISVARRTR